MKACLLLDMAKENKKEWRDIANNYSKKRRHYNGKYLEKSLLLDEETEIQLYRVIEKEISQVLKTSLKPIQFGFFSKNGFNLNKKYDYIFIVLDDLYR